MSSSLSRMDYDDTYDPHGDRESETPTGPPTFFVFAGQNYYPAGGMDDLHSSHHTVEEAREAEQAVLASRHHDWAHIAQFTDQGLVEIR